MKTMNFKFIMPVAFVALGLMGALSTSAMERTAAKSGAVIGYKKIVGGTPPCQPVHSCDQVPNFLCKSTIDNSQLYQYVSDTQCPTMLYRSTQ